MEDSRVRRLLKWADGESDGPHKVDIFFTQRCNLRCRFCEFPNTPAQDLQNELSHEELMRIARDAGRMGARVFGILGGEPFVKLRSLIQVMEEAKRGGMDGSIVTNGTIMDEEAIRALIRMEWDLIRFSIDGVEAATHDHLRGVPGSFAKSIGVMERLIELKRTLGERLPTMEINTVLNRRNMREIPDVVAMASRLDCRSLFLLPMIEFGESLEDLTLTEADAPVVVACLEEARERADELGVHTNIDEILADSLYHKSSEIDTVLLAEDKVAVESYIPCFFPWLGLSFDAQGYATPCGQLETDWADHIRGKGLDDIWYGDAFSRLRRTMAGRVLPRACSNCCLPLVVENGEIRRALGREAEGRLSQAVSKVPQR